MGSGPRSSRRGGACGARRGPAGGADPARAAGCKLWGRGRALGASSRGGGGSAPWARSGPRASPQELPSRAALELGAKKTEAGIRSSLSTSSEHMLPKLGPARDENGKARLLPSQLLSSALQALATKPPPLAAWGKVHSSLISSSAPLFHLHLIPLDPWLRKCSSSFSMSMIISTDAQEARAPRLKPPSCPCPLPGLQK